jgi:undecaprenyl-diphosphatase
MEVWQAVILGLVEGITEYLPISSTGHLILASALLGLDEPAEVKESVDAFNVVIQGGAILAVLGLYRGRVIQMMRGLVGKDTAGLRLMVNLSVAFIPAAVLGFLLGGTISRLLFSPGPVLAALLLGGVWMIWLDGWRKKHLERERVGGIPEEESRFNLTVDDLDWRRALIIGLLQCVGMWPGTSRSMMTIAGGTMLGLKPRDAAEFSFLLGLPTLGAACAYKLWKNLRESQDAGTPNMFEQLGWMPIAVGIAVATVSAAFAIKWLVGFLTKHGLSPFGWYRIALCVVMGVLIAAGMLHIER